VTEQPENEQPRDEETGAGATPSEPEAPETPAADAPAEEEAVTPAAPQAGAETPADEPAGGAEEEAPAAPAEPAQPAPAAEEAPAEPAERAEEAPAQPAPAAEQPAPPAQARDAEDEEYEPAPRLRPEIPGADLIPDIVPEGQEFLDAEAQAAAEAEAEALAARAQEESEESNLPIADAAIDLAAGARYTATGKRKTAVARVILKPGDGTYTINGKTLTEFFPRETLQRIIRQPLETVGYESRMDVVARMHGGGVAAQAGALRHGISRALIVADPNLRGELKRRGFLTRDPRVKERKKAGLKKARKRPQFSKR
jgi:small subunit ribosomal protein S9